MRWVMSPSTFAIIRKLKDADGNLLVPASPMGNAAAPAAAPTLFDVPVILSDNAPAMTTGNTPIWFGRLDLAYGIAIRSPRLDVDGSAYFATDEIGIRNVVELDASPLDVNAGGVITMA